jgi:hypothetical protein
MQQFLALIIPVGNQGPGGPGGSPPYVDIGFPMPQPPFPGQQPPHPSHPIYNPGGPPGSSPPGYWGGGMGPGVKPQPHPEHPIYFPPPGGQPPLGIWGPPTMPPGFWGGGMGPGVKPQPHPEHPIVLPPNLPPEIPPPEGGGSPIPIDWKTGWTAETGWVVVGIPTDPHPTPSTAPPA